jgi:RND superfamily putative drug exporter
MMPTPRRAAVGRGRLHQLGSLCVRNSWRVVIAWGALLVLLAGLATVSGGRVSDAITVPGSEAEAGRAAVERQFPGLSGASALLVFHKPGLAEDEQAKSSISAALTAVTELPGVTAVIDPFEYPETHLSADGATAYADVVYSEGLGEVGPEGAARLDEALSDPRSVGVESLVGGDLAFATSGAETGVAELMGLLAAAILLLIVFGSVLAAGLPILVALVSVLLTSAVLYLAAASVDVPTEAPQIAAMIGLGVGIDYALLLVKRFREELEAGADVEGAVEIAVSTAGRSVLYAGGTVVVSVMALVLTGLPLIATLGLTAALVVAVAVAAALTLLPALLSLGGSKLSRSRRSGTAVPKGTWRRWTTHVMARPKTAIFSAVALLVLLASPVTALNLSMPDGSSTAEGSDTRRAYDRMSEVFGPGSNGPLYIVAEAEAAVIEPLGDQLVDLARGVPGVVRVAPAVAAPGGGGLLVQVLPSTAPAEADTGSIVAALRSSIDSTDLEGRVYVTGFSALYSDLTSTLSETFFRVVAFIVLSSALLMLVLLRSVAVAIRAGLLNLLSIGAAFGVVVLVFQFGVGASLFGAQEMQAIPSFAPIFFLAVVFGLSLDYEVFMMSRIREEVVTSRDWREGIVRGMERTGGVVTSASAVMIVVFVAFTLSSEPLLKLLGLGLAVAVLLDATIIRLLLVPATLAVLGPKAWAVPWFLDRILPGQAPVLTAAQPVPALAAFGPPRQRHEDEPANVAIAIPSSEEGS